MVASASPTSAVISASRLCDFCSRLWSQRAPARPVQPHCASGAARRRTPSSPASWRIVFCNVFETKRGGRGVRRCQELTLRIGESGQEDS